MGFEPLKVHVVVMIEEIGDQRILMHTMAGSPAIYTDSITAELHCAQLRETHSTYKFRVIDTPVL